MTTALGEILLAAAAVVLIVLWLFQFVQLMALADGDFPGRYDKPLWVAAFLWLAFLAPFAFMYWKSAVIKARRMQSGVDSE